MKTTSLKNKCRHYLTIIAVVCCMASAIAAHSQNTITFDGIPGMINAPTTPVPFQSQLSTQFLSNFGVSFSSGSSFVSVVNINIDASPNTNAIGGSTASGNLTYSGANPIVATFFDPNNTSISATTDLVSFRCDNYGDGLNVTLNAYDINNNLINSFTMVDNGGETLQVSGPGIHSVQFIGTVDDSGAAVDEISFDTVTPVPEPSTIALLTVAGALFCAIYKKSNVRVCQKRCS
jgi:hypothetical protein